MCVRMASKGFVSTKELKYYNREILYLEDYMMIVESGKYGGEEK